MQNLVFSPEEVMEAARQLAASRYADALFLVATGSILNGAGVAGSDLDLVVIHRSLPAAFRESLVFNGLPVEAFNHDIETIQWFIDDSFEQGNGLMAHMIATGVAIADRHNLFPHLKNCADRILEALKTKESDTSAARYSISNLLDDLRGDRPPAELRAVLYEVYGKLGNLVLQTHGHMTAMNKRIARELHAHFPDVLQTMDDVMTRAHAGVLSDGDIDRLEKILDDCGGYLFDGYKQTAPADRRRAAVWMRDIKEKEF